MYIDEVIPNYCIQLWQQCREQIPLFLSGAPIKNRNLQIRANSSIVPGSQQSVFLIKSGILNEVYENRTIITYEENDLAGADSCLGNKATRIVSDFAVIVDEYDSNSLMQHIRQDEQRFSAWNAYLMNLMQSFQILMCYHKKEEITFQPEVRHYQTGETIITEGAEDNEVFTLLSGSAQAIVGNTPVGEIRTNEIFGAIAALTGARRTANVIATSNCTVLVVPCERFQSLLEARPDTLSKLIEDMARAIKSGNEKIVALSKAE
ncbi:MAG: cyclic nucleotide-binding domain-containing protein [Gammaproteobacteria bacterium]|nr:MAG: cyclic nucleotide-binding domain-containing protein [Gammaproteobacteria bacterium]